MDVVLVCSFSEYDSTRHKVLKLVVMPSACESANSDFPISMKIVLPGFYVK